MSTSAISIWNGKPYRCQVAERIVVDMYEQQAPLAQLRRKQPHAELATPKVPEAIVHLRPAERRRIISRAREVNPSVLA